MDILSAKMTKYATNAMFATKISFINDIANFCEIVGAEITSVRKGIGCDSRIGYHFIYAGAGYGGACFPKNAKALIKSSGQNNYSLEVLKAVEDVNDHQKMVLYNKVKNHFNGDLKGKRFGIWGLSFKPNTDDMREAPALVVIDKLIEAGAQAIGYDPVAIHECMSRIGDKIDYANDQYEAIKDVDAFILIKWSEIRVPKRKEMENLIKNKLFFDGRNVYETDDLKKWELAIF